MKKYSVLFSVISCAALLMSAGCSTVTEIYNDPSNQVDDVRSEYTVSSAELRQAAQAAIEEALLDEDFNEAVNEYKAKHDGKRPLMKLAQTRNDTDDPNLNTTELNGFIENQLRKAKKVRITRAEGANKDKSIAASRDLQYDSNFKADTVAQEGTIEAAAFIMKPYVISNKVTSGKKKNVTRTFTIEIFDTNGVVIMKCDKQLGFKQTKGTFGW